MTAQPPDGGRRSRGLQTEVRGLVHPASVLCIHRNTNRSSGLLLSGKLVVSTERPPGVRRLAGAAREG